MKSLSGGEKSRLKLSRLLFEDINLLILDEPTNHLDIDSIETLEETLSLFEGTILFISHDRYFINKLCSKVVDLESEKFTNFPGNYEYYREKRDENKQIEESISILEEKLKILQENMNSLGNDYEELKKCLEEEAVIKRALEGLVEEWCK